MFTPDAGTDTKTYYTDPLPAAFIENLNDHDDTLNFVFQIHATTAVGVYNVKCYCRLEPSGVINDEVEFAIHVIEITVPTINSKFYKITDTTLSFDLDSY